MKNLLHWRRLDTSDSDHLLIKNCKWGNKSSQNSGPSLQSLHIISLRLKPRKLAPACQWKEIQVLDTFASASLFRPRNSLHIVDSKSEAYYLQNGHSPCWKHRNDLQPNVTVRTACQQVKSVSNSSFKKNERCQLHRLCCIPPTTDVSILLQPLFHILHKKFYRDCICAFGDLNCWISLAITMSIVCFRYQLYCSPVSGE